jgi:hypothetical protein
VLCPTHPDSPILQMRKWRLRASVCQFKEHCPQSHVFWPRTPEPPCSHLITARAPGSQALTVVAATPGCAIFPEVDEVHQGLGALGTHEAGGVPLLAVPGPVRVDHRAVGWDHSLAELTDLGRWGRTQQVRESGGCGDLGSSPSPSLSSSCVTLGKVTHLSVAQYCTLLGKGC